MDEEIAIRFVESGDREFWKSLDRHLNETEFDRKVRDKMGYVLQWRGEPAAILRYNLFWDNTPFCNLLYVAEKWQGRGMGAALMAHWENEMKAQGHDMVMTSTQADESAQHFYRKLGYRDAGGFVLDLPGHEQPLELILIKGI